MKLNSHKDHITSHSSRTVRISLDNKTKVDCRRYRNRYAGFVKININWEYRVVSRRQGQKKRHSKHEQILFMWFFFPFLFMDYCCWAACNKVFKVYVICNVWIWITQVENFNERNVRPKKKFLISLAKNVYLERKSVLHRWLWKESREFAIHLDCLQ